MAKNLKNLLPSYPSRSCLASQTKRGERGSLSATLFTQRGFTLVETLVVMSVMVLLTSILITYSRSGENQIILFKDQAKVVGMLLKAKSLALQGHVLESGFVCGYGVHFDSTSKEFLIFKDIATPCSESDNEYSGETEDFERQELDFRLEFSSLEFTDILFIPPDPITIIDGDIGNNGSFEIVIAAVDGSGDKKVIVNDFGQVTIQ